MKHDIKWSDERYKGRRLTVFRLLQKYLIVLAKRCTEDYTGYALKTVYPLLPFQPLAADIKHVYSVEMNQGVSTEYPEQGGEPE
jgi:hypothetical protein